MSQPRIALVGGDIMFASQLRTATGASLVEPGSADVVFVDLNSAQDDRIGTIGELARGDARPQLIAFCRHDDLSAQQRARAAGATRIIANGALRKVAAAIAAGENE